MYINSFHYFRTSAKQLNFITLERKIHLYFMNFSIVSECARKMDSITYRTLYIYINSKQMNEIHIHIHELSPSFPFMHNQLFQLP